MDDRPKDQIDDIDLYYLALGNFIHRFSMVEFFLLVILADHAGVDSKTARAVFSGVRVHEAMSLIRRTYEAREEEEDPLIKPTFKQIGDINAARNDIVHYGATFEDGKPAFVSNEVRALTPERVHHFPVSANILLQMINDLLTIHWRLDAIYQRHKISEDHFNRLYAEHLQTPWQYKHAPRAGGRPKNRARNPKQQDPPRSSQD